MNNNIPIKELHSKGGNKGDNENLAKLALTRALIGRMPGMHQPGMAPIKPLSNKINIK